MKTGHTKPSARTTRQKHNKKTNKSHSSTRSDAGNTPNVSTYQNKVPVSREVVRLHRSKVGQKCLAKEHLCPPNPPPPPRIRHVGRRRRQEEDGCHLCTGGNNGKLLNRGGLGENCPVHVEASTFLCVCVCALCCCLFCVCVFRLFVTIESVSNTLITHSETQCFPPVESAFCVELSQTLCKPDDQDGRISTCFRANT